MDARAHPIAVTLVRRNGSEASFSELSAITIEGPVESVNGNHNGLTINLDDDSDAWLVDDTLIIGFEAGLDRHEAPEGATAINWSESAR